MREGRSLTAASNIVSFTLKSIFRNLSSSSLSDNFFFPRLTYLQFTQRQRYKVTKYRQNDRINTSFLSLFLLIHVSTNWEVIIFCDPPRKKRKEKKRKIDSMPSKRLQNSKKKKNQHAIPILLQGFLSPNTKSSLSWTGLGLE